MEINKEVKTFLFEYICDKCGEGKMKHTGTVYYTNPLQYPHRCEKCGFEKTFNNVYPYIGHEQ